MGQHPEDQLAELNCPEKSLNFCFRRRKFYFQSPVSQKLSQNTALNNNLFDCCFA